MSVFLPLAHGIAGSRDAQVLIEKTARRIAHGAVDTYMGPLSDIGHTYINQTPYWADPPSKKKVKYSRYPRGSYGVKRRSSFRPKFKNYSSFTPKKCCCCCQNNVMPRRYRRRRRPYRRYRRRSRRFGRRRRFNKNRRRYQRLNWKKGAFHGVGPQCAPTHAFCKMRRKFAGIYTFPATAVQTRKTMIVSHDLARAGYGMEPLETSSDLFSAVEYTTPHAITYLMDSFNEVRCFKLVVQIKFFVPPPGAIEDSIGYVPLVFGMTAYDNDAAAADEPQTTTKLHDMMLDNKTTMKIARPWWNYAAAGNEWKTGFATPNFIKFKNYASVPKRLEYTKSKEYFQDEAYANHITGTLGSRTMVTPSKQGEVLQELNVHRLSSAAFTATGVASDLDVYAMGTVTQYTLWGKPNNALRFTD